MGSYALRVCTDSADRLSCNGIYKSIAAGLLAVNFPVIQCRLGSNGVKELQLQCEAARAREAQESVLGGLGVVRMRLNG